MSAEHDLARAIMGSAAGPGIYRVLMGAVCTAWNGTTYANTVTDGLTTYTNLPVLAPTLMVTGRVLLGVGPGGPIILGPLYQAT